MRVHPAGYPSRQEVLRRHGRDPRREGRRQQREDALQGRGVCVLRDRMSSTWAPLWPG